MAYAAKNYHEALPDAFSYYNWQRGMKVQDAFPDIPIEQREMLISGAHPECLLEEDVRIS